MPPTVAAACMELQQIAAYFQAIAAGDLSDVEDVLASVKSSKKGTRALVKHSITHSPHWAQLETPSRQHAVANATFGKAVREMVARLDGGEEESVEAALAELPAWTLCHQA